MPWGEDALTEKLPLTAVGVTRKDQLDAAVGEIREIVFGVMGQKDMGPLFRAELV